jgi:uncharacterized iron-regulated membrane protein
LMAVLALCLILAVCSGLYLAWPGAPHWQRLLYLRRSQGWRVLIGDLHRWLGLLSAGALLLIAVTGFNLAYPPLLEQLADAEGMGHNDAGPNIHSSAQPNNRPITIEQAMLIARGLFASAEVKRITTPRGELGTYRINLRQQDELNQHHPFTTVWIDRWSGHILAVNNAHRFSAAQTLAAWQWPLHTGEALGGAARPFWFAAGLTPGLLWLSGLAQWLYRSGRWHNRAVHLPKLYPLRSKLPPASFPVQLKRYWPVILRPYHIAMYWSYPHRQRLLRYWRQRR